jgi:hypothetical protein
MYNSRSIKASQVVPNLLIPVLELRPHLLAQLPEPTQSTPQPPANTREYRQSTGDYYENPDTSAVADFGHVHAENRRSRVDRDEDERKDGDCRVQVISRWHRKPGSESKTYERQRSCFHQLRVSSPRVGPSAAAC